MAPPETDIDECFPDIHELFCHYNALYFGDALGACVVSWGSKRMTLSAGLCVYLSGGSCEIRLSEPLLKFRSSADLKDTLLHEMIHAYLWIKGNNKNHGTHGPSFEKLMNEINSSTLIDNQRPDGGYNITIYHSFHDEVDNYRTHHWVCQSCGDLIKRALNREPSPSDCVVKVEHKKLCKHPSCHWHQHARLCSGSYIKISEPSGYTRKKMRLKGDGHQEKGKDEYKDASSGKAVQVTRNSHGRKIKASRNNPSRSGMRTIDKFYKVASNSSLSDGTSQSENGDCYEPRSEGSSLYEEGCSRQIVIASSGVYVPRKKRNASHLRNKLYDVIIEWKKYYMNENIEHQEEAEPLHNKRAERRKKQKLNSVELVETFNYPEHGIVLMEDMGARVASDSCEGLIRAGNKQLNRYHNSQTHPRGDLHPIPCLEESEDGDIVEILEG